MYVNKGEMRMGKDNKIKIIIIIMFLCFAAAITIFLITMKLDIGPGSEITIEGIHSSQLKEFYITFFFETDNDSNGVNGVLDRETVPYEEGTVEYKVWNAFTDYSDADGYYFMKKFWSYNDYYTPFNLICNTSSSSFKILMYNPDQDIFITSKAYDKYAFNSYYELDMDKIFAESPEIVLTRWKYNRTDEIKEGLIFRIILTVLIELGIAFIFMLNGKKTVLCIFSVTSVMQIIFNIILNYVVYLRGTGLTLNIIYSCFGFVIFIIETVLFSLLLPRISDEKVRIRKCILYSFIANAAALAVGWLLLNTAYEISIFL